MAKKQVSAAKRKKAELKVPKKLYKALRKEAKKKDVRVLSLLSQFPRGALEREKIKNVIDSGRRLDPQGF
jgi:hypothetical protein